MKKSGTEQLKSEYANLKRTTQRELRRSYWSYIENILDPADTNSQSAQNQFSTMKRFWSYIKHRRKDSSCVASLKVNGKLYSNSADKANILNGQFQQAFSTDNKQAVGEAYFDPVALETPALEDIVISCLGVEKLLQNLVPHKAAGPDTISPRVLNSLSSEIAPLLTLIFRRSLDTGDVPADWRKASVCPVYKKGPKYLAENYRPISLTSIACKIFEHLIASAIMKHAESNHLLYHLQHGFRKGRSCESQLIDLIDDVTKNLDEGRQTDMLVMDFAKAFDKVNHRLLIEKLKNYGIQGKICIWIENWLKNRQQTVVVDGEMSSTIHVSSGVPQGSVLGPSLFLYYINDLPASLHSRVRLFADDTIAYLCIASKSDSDILQNDLNAMGDWASRWSMVFHPEKCNVLIVSTKKRC